MPKPYQYQKSYDPFISDMQEGITYATDDARWGGIPQARVLEVERLTLLLRLEEIAAFKRIGEYLKLIANTLEAGR